MTDIKTTPQKAELSYDEITIEEQGGYTVVIFRFEGEKVYELQPGIPHQNLCSGVPLSISGLKGSVEVEIT